VLNELVRGIEHALDDAPRMKDLGFVLVVVDPDDSSLSMTHSPWMGQDEAVDVLSSALEVVATTGEPSGNA
jgi:hypothetical protein